MLLLLISLTVVWLAVGVCVVAACRAAAAGDRGVCRESAPIVQRRRPPRRGPANERPGAQRRLERGAVGARRRGGATV